MQRDNITLMFTQHETHTDWPGAKEHDPAKTRQTRELLKSVLGREMPRQPMKEWIGARRIRSEPVQDRLPVESTRQHIARSRVGLPKPARGPGDLQDGPGRKLTQGLIGSRDRLEAGAPDRDRLPPHVDCDEGEHGDAEAEEPDVGAASSESREGSFHPIDTDPREHWGLVLSVASLAKMSLPFACTAVSQYLALGANDPSSISLDLL